MSKIFDLTHTIAPGMPVYPGTESPILTAGNTIEKDGFAETLLSIFSHTGTHMDAPAHMKVGGATLDTLDISRFMGTAAVIPCEEGATMQAVNAFRDIADRADFLILKTGWEKYWGKPEYFAWPPVEREVMEYAAATGKKGVGIDSMSSDPDDESFENHAIAFNAGMVLVENLCNLDAISGRLVQFYALPLKFIDSDGAPVRAVAVVE